MNLNNFPLLSNIFQHSKINPEFVESHSIWKTDSCEIFFTEIDEKMYQIPVAFSNPVFSNIINGQKQIEIDSQNSFLFNKNQTLILPKNSHLKIDFPQATSKQPTQCTSVSINPDFLIKKTEMLNEKAPKLNSEWNLNIQEFSLLNSTKINQIFHRITRDLLNQRKTLIENWEESQLDMLLIAIMQQQNRELPNLKSRKTPSIIQSLVAFIKENPEKTGSLDQLCNQACMSPSTLYRYFKRELGISPIEFIIEQKITKAKNILSSSLIPIKEVSYLSGFEDSNYFIRLFKKHEGITPKQYQQSLVKEC
ncbi:AraC family transcriptional regulator [Flavobacterium sp. NKUCC04_CG]|uniref:AraC family transcriptional regulator n=1 Tax=Flavobacterium sp. NKUCC04_CG TaxID=2842121 RepID=UPI001C5A845B|nr:AraC family transcriptional regulator [Flavobacterium sp. NKUCC04_CG]MBW3519355.1 AraC family transcriptional regulator [Flavobacterium sp. NKUCC04_CG]